jgi:DNA-binding CsgD family transcriptional regulator
MKINRPVNITFERHLQSVFYAKDETDERDIFRLLSKFKKLSVAVHYTTPLFFILDYTRSQYLLMTDALELMLAQNPRAFLEGGIPMLIDIFQPEDFKIYNEKIFPVNIQFLQGQPQETHQQFIFSYNFRVRHKDGHYVPLWQRGCYITAAGTGLPLYSLGMVMDISPFKKDRLIYHAIEKIEGQPGSLSKSMLASNCFFPHEEDQLLSLRERQILECLAEGKSGKQIAWLLKISENTMANHRKNMLRKTNTKNMAELIAFSIRHHII